MKNLEQLEKAYKGFWEKPEGTLGMIFGLVVGGGILYGLYLILPFLITLLTNAITAVALMAVLAILIYVIFSKDTRRIGKLLYKMVMRKITGFIIETDPIGIVKEHVLGMKKNKAEVDRQVASLKGQIKILDTLVSENTNLINKAMKTADLAKREDKRNQLILNTRKAGRLKEQNITFGGMLNSLRMLYQRLFKVSEVLDILIEDTEDEIKTKERQRMAIHAAHKAMTSALRVLNGNPDERALFEAAMQHIADDIAFKAGEIEHYLDFTKSFVESVDLQNGVYEEEGLEMLQEWDKRIDNLLLDEGKRRTDFLLGPHKGNYNLSLDQFSNSPAYNTIEKIENDFDKIFKTKEIRKEIQADGNETRG